MSIYIHIDILYIHSKVTTNVYIYTHNYIWIIGTCYCEAILLPLHNRLLITCLGGRNLGAASCFGPWYLACQSLEWCNTSARCSFPRSPEKRGDIGDSSYQETDVMYLGFCLGIYYFLSVFLENEDSKSPKCWTYPTALDLYVPGMFVENCENPRAPCHFGAPSWLCTKHIVGKITCR